MNHYTVHFTLSSIRSPHLSLQMILVSLLFLFSSSFLGCASQEMDGSLSNAETTPRYEEGEMGGADVQETGYFPDDEMSGGYDAYGGAAGGRAAEGGEFAGSESSDFDCDDLLVTFTDSEISMCIKLDEETSCYDLSQISGCVDRDGDCAWDCPENVIIPAHLIDPDDQRAHIGPTVEESSGEPPPEDPAPITDMDDVDLGIDMEREEMDIVNMAANTSFLNDVLCEEERCSLSLDVDENFRQVTSCGSDRFVVLVERGSEFILAQYWISDLDLSTVETQQIILSREDVPQWIACKGDHVFFSSPELGWIKDWHTDLSTPQSSRVLSAARTLVDSVDRSIQNLNLSQSGIISWTYTYQEREDPNGGVQEGGAQDICQLNINHNQSDRHICFNVNPSAPIEALVQEVIITDYSNNMSNVKVGWLDQGEIYTGFLSRSNEGISLQERNSSTAVNLYGTTTWLVWQTELNSPLLNMYPWGHSEEGDLLLTPYTLNVELREFTEVEINQVHSNILLFKGLRANGESQWATYELNTGNINQINLMTDEEIPSKNISFDGQWFLWYASRPSTPDGSNPSMMITPQLHFVLVD